MGGTPSGIRPFGVPQDRLGPIRWSSQTACKVPTRFAPSRFETRCDADTMPAIQGVAVALPPPDGIGIMRRPPGTRGPLRRPTPMSSVGRIHALDEPTADPPAADPVTARAAELLRRAADGDRAAFGQLVVLYQDRMYTAVLRLVGNRDEAAELTQEAFAKALAALDGFRGNAHPYTWLFRIALNLALSRLRQGRRRRTFSLDAATDGAGARPGDQAANLIARVRAGGGADPADAAERRERAEQVVAALGRVDPDHRAVLVMRDVDGLDYQQMAEVLGLPLGTLKSRLFRARLALRDELRAYMNGGAA